MRHRVLHGQAVEQGLLEYQIEMFRRILPHVTSVHLTPSEFGLQIAHVGDNRVTDIDRFQMRKSRIE